jgi:hypothetical protein
MYRGGRGGAGTACLDAARAALVRPYVRTDRIVTRPATCRSVETDTIGIHPSGSECMMRLKTAGRLILAVAVAGSLQACAALSNVRVQPLQNENASASRSMLSLYNPLPFQHRSQSDGALLRAPHDRNPRYIYLGY